MLLELLLLLLLLLLLWGEAERRKPQCGKDWLGSGRRDGREKGVQVW